MRRTLAPLVSLTVSAFAAAPAQQSQLIAQWNRNVTEFRGQIGRRLTFICLPQVGGPPATRSAERYSRPHVVTYDNPSWGCHR